MDLLLRDWGCGAMHGDCSTLNPTCADCFFWMFFPLPLQLLFQSALMLEKQLMKFAAVQTFVADITWAREFYEVCRGLKDLDGNLLELIQKN